MEYTIGEVSSLLHISRDMIRYYEKQGAIRSKRNANNNYRTYDSMEIFWLIECMQHKSWGIPINDIAGIRQNHYSKRTADFLREEARRQEAEAAYTFMYAERLGDLYKYAQLGIANIGNFWVDEIPAEYRLHLVSGRGDNYSSLNLPEIASKYLFSDRCLPFSDNGMTLLDDRVEWELIIQEKHVKVLERLGEKLPECFVRIPESLCLCTVIDIGEIGEFDHASLNSLRKYALSRNYKVAEDSLIRGKLLGRGFEGDRFRRILRLMIPIITD